MIRLGKPGPWVRIPASPPVNTLIQGEVAEWLKARAWRARDPKGPRVRIPASPPVEKWGAFEEETEGTFRRKIQAALF